MNLSGRAALPQNGQPTPLEASPAVVSEAAARHGKASPFLKPSTTVYSCSTQTNALLVDRSMCTCPLHYSVHRPEGSTGVMSGHYLTPGTSPDGTALRTGTINGIVVPQTTSTATLEPVSCALFDPRLRQS
eukprot:1156170-Pelagomonas_calceolata.AAC.6